ncbi:MAG: OmpA family protein [Methyloprofundus sp.]|nr:OmpA family protein [Methyloprofundus sp.]
MRYFGALDLLAMTIRIYLLQRMNKMLDIFGIITFILNFLIKKMKRLLIAFILVTLLAACQKSSTKNVKVSPEAVPGQVAFGALAGMDKKQYLFEQHALFRSKLLDKGVESTIEGDTLILNIPGNITFSINSAKMNWNINDILNRITPVLKEYDQTSILVLGHSDTRGDKVINQRLSEQRAKLIRDYFIRSGIDAQRITSRGVGSDDLFIQDDLTTMDRSLNRRIILQIKVLDQVTGETPVNQVNEAVLVDPINEAVLVDPIDEAVLVDPIDEDAFVDQVPEDVLIDPVREEIPVQVIEK